MSESKALTLPDGLLDAAKNYLDITWTEDAGDAKLSGILARGMTYLDHKAGQTLDYGEGTDARALLFDYARYARAQALQDFGADFASDLLRLHMDGEVAEYEAEQQSDQ